LEFSRTLDTHYLVFKEQSRLLYFSQPRRPCQGIFFRPPPERQLFL